MTDPTLPAGRGLTHRPAPTSLREWRGRLSQARSGHELLDLLISPHDAKRLVAALPLEDLHEALVRIGLADATEVLSLCTGEQVRGLLDLEGWQRDEPLLERLDPWLEALAQAGPDILGPRLLALDDELLTWLVRGTCEVLIIEDREAFEPPDGDSVLTPDGRICLHFPNGLPRDLPIKIFLDWLMRTDAAHCINLLVHASSALDSELVETSYRWRSARMADLGFVETYEAQVVYTPPAGQIPKATAVIGGAPTAHLWLTLVASPEARISQALAALDGPALADVEAGLAFLANQALSADGVEAWDRERRGEVMARLRAGLGLGLVRLAGPEASPSKDALILSETSPTLIFRTGYAQMLAAVAPLKRAVSRRALATPEGRLAAMDLTHLEPAVVGLVGSRHPQRPDGGPLATSAELEEAARISSVVAALAERASERPGDVAVGAYLLSWLVRELVGLTGPGPLPMELLPQAHHALFEGGRWRSEARVLAAATWARLPGPDVAGALEALLTEAEEQLASLTPEALEPRFLPFLWLTPSLP